uniref:Uncharacterized protein n=1 Tax=Arundo donax TaxID=35708 RepID=A0A0A9HMZ5_ARUDO
MQSTSQSAHIIVVYVTTFGSIRLATI